MSIIVNVDVMLAKRKMTSGELAERDEGIKIARRTIAKYRESMNIPTSAERKRNALKNI